jgi:hypothetical protein
MKKLIVLFLGFTLSTATLFAANNEPGPVTIAKKELRTQIVKLLGNKEFPLKADFVKAEISLLINKEGEIIIVSIHSKNTLLKDYVKRKLNYKKVKVNTLRKMKVYRIPLKIVKS